MKKRRILSVALLALCFGLFVFGVFAVKRAQLNVGGTIGFIAHDCHVVVNGTIEGDAVKQRVQNNEPVVDELNNPVYDGDFDGDPSEQRPFFAEQEINTNIPGYNDVTLEQPTIYFSDLTETGVPAVITLRFSVENLSHYPIKVEISAMMDKSNVTTTVPTRQIFLAEGQSGNLVVTYTLGEDPDTHSYESFEDDPNGTYDTNDPNYQAGDKDYRVVLSFAKYNDPIVQTQQEDKTTYYYTQGSNVYQYTVGNVSGAQSAHTLVNPSNLVIADTSNAQASIDDYEDGQVILLKSGNYGNLTVAAEAANSDSLVILGENGAVVRGLITLGANAPALTLRNIRFAGAAGELSADGDVLAGIYSESAANLVVDNCQFMNIERFAGTASAIKLDAVNGLVVSNCKFDGVDAHALELGAVSGEISITGNEFKDVHGQTIYVSGAVSGLTQATVITGNTFKAKAVADMDGKDGNICYSATANANLVVGANTFEDTLDTTDAASLLPQFNNFAYTPAP